MRRTKKMHLVNVRRIIFLAVKKRRTLRRMKRNVEQRFEDVQVNLCDTYIVYATLERR